MASFSRTLGRWDPVRVAALASGAAFAALVAAYVVTGATSAVTTAGVIAAAVLVAIAGSGLLYAWRLGAAGFVE